MELSPEAFCERLAVISESEGIPYYRLRLLFGEEKRYEEAVVRYKGHFAIYSAFTCFVLETVELINTRYKDKISAPVPEFYPLFVPRMAHSFQTLCGAHRVATCGYPLHAYTFLRNTFDTLVLISATLQKITDFYSVEGLDRDKPSEKLDMLAIKKRRKKTEYEVRLKMTGSQSNLTPPTLKALDDWDTLFDLEVHGARLSLGAAQDWMKGIGSLPLLPRFNEIQFGMFMNRYCEVSWMTHRLMSIHQLPGMSLPDAWKEKWRVLDPINGS